MKREIGGLFWGVLCVGLLAALFALLGVLAVREGYLSPPQEKQIRHERPAGMHKEHPALEIT